MKLFAVLAVLLLATPALAQTTNITLPVPNTAIPDLLQACDDVVGRFRAKEDTTNAECALKLIQLGQHEVVRKVARRNAQAIASQAESAAVAAARVNFPEPLRPAVCGDGGVDIRAGELCDDGASNSDAVPDACRSDCEPARCGDNVVDTGEVCDDNGQLCLGDCSGLK